MNYFLVFDRQRSTVDSHLLDAALKLDQWLFLLDPRTFERVRQVLLPMTSGTSRQEFACSRVLFGIVAALPHATSVECVSEKNADAEEGKQCCHDLGPSPCPWLAMPGKVALRNWR
jgi:hypothetical protein